ncbi:MAG: S-layer homology domain-containing protein [Oscillospiraceae bacterium]|nr:S-layer homology domain-containing protein [Oscillospiraceae bacterium]
MKRWLSLLLAAVLAAMLILPAGAVGFSDVTDVPTLSAVESLRIMGVISGFPDGSFRPSGNLTRAQFCKMAVYAMGAQDELAAYRAITVFPDVANHWARDYVNLSAKGHKLLAGFPDGTFRPESTVTAGQAVTILLRMLGYEDAAIGGIWPQAYMEKAAAIKLTEGTGIANGLAALTRQQAAKLFVRLLQTQTASGSTYYTLSEETTLTALDGGSGTMTVSDGKKYPLRYTVDSTTLLGQRGKIVTDQKGNAVTFLPAAAASTTISDTAIVVAQNGSTAGFDILSGGKNYTLYKNGLPATAKDLRVNDTAIYRADTNAILVSDAHLSVRYEAASPSKQQPNILTALGGVQFTVLPSAITELSHRAIGSQITILLTADGQVAGVTDDSKVATGNTLGYVKDGVLSLCAGGTLIPLAGVNADLSAYEGCIVRINAYTAGKIVLTEATAGASGSFNPETATVGSRKLADNALIIDYGNRVAPGSLKETVSESSIAFTRTNWKDEVDLIVLHKGNAPLYGRIRMDDSSTRSFTFSNGATAFTSTSQNAFADGDFVKVQRYADGSIVTLLQKFADVSTSAWLSDRYITLDGQTYTISDDLRCYNQESGQWITPSQARTFYTSMNLYVEGTTVRCIEVGAK